MKKIFVVIVSVLACSVMTVAATSATKVGKLKNGRIVQAVQPTTVTYAGVKIFVPKGQTVLLGQRDNGSIVIRGLNIDRVQLDDAFLSTKGYSIVSYQPSTRIAFLNHGDMMTVTDAAGETASVSGQGAISTTNTAVNSNTVAELQEQAKQDAQEVVGTLDQMAVLTGDAIAVSAANEQAVQDVEETLSPSAPR